MSAVVSPSMAWQWAPEVLAFAARMQVAPYLDPLLEATRKLFPAAQGLKVFVDVDQELLDVSWIVFEVSVPPTNVPDYIAGKRRWTDELLRICPAPFICTFVLNLIPHES